MYNEESIAAESMRELSSYMSANFSNWEIVVSNDGSRDRTKEIMTSLCKEIDGLRLVSYDDNRGKGSAIREGILANGGASSDNDLFQTARNIIIIMTI